VVASRALFSLFNDHRCRVNCAKRFFTIDARYADFEGGSFITANRYAKIAFRSGFIDLSAIIDVNHTFIIHRSRHRAHADKSVFTVLCPLNTIIRLSQPDLVFRRR